MVKLLMIELKYTIGFTGDLGFFSRYITQFAVQPC